MGREYAKVKLTIWNDPDFQALSPKAQRLYFVLLTHPTKNIVGPSDLPGRRLWSNGANPHNQA